MKLNHSALGSISHGTLRSADLLSAFIGESESIQLTNGEYFADPANHALHDAIANTIGAAQDCFTDEGDDIREESLEEASQLINETFPDLFQQFAPPYCYFGTHEGDGSDFGFWPSWEQIEELPCISDNSNESIAAEQSDDYSTDVRYVNDHGNVTVYGADGSVLLELV